MLACEGFIRTCRWNVQGHCQWSPLYVLILSWHSLGLLLLACSFKHWPVSSDEPAKPQEDHGQCLTVHIWMKHKWLSKTVYESFILERAFEYGAGWWYTGETAFCYPWCCLDHHPQRPPPSSACREISSDTQWSWAWRKGGGEMLPWPSRIMTLERGCWLQWRVTVCKLLSPRRLTSVYSNKRFPNCLLPQIHPAMLFRSTESTW